ncbi:phosphodiesterase [Haematococcus lacustris]|uniref:Phosphodiesterase n=1 Tax=Haematococcus lacustris TaxID=44745 RepID=A0A699ZUI1_HAELA|nr:phosphodiesterase [Haematococcus lacustris]
MPSRPAEASGDSLANGVHRDVNPGLWRELARIWHRGSRRASGCVGTGGAAVGPVVGSWSLCPKLEVPDIHVAGVKFLKPVSTSTLKFIPTLSLMLTLTQSAGRILKAAATASRAHPHTLAIPMLLFALSVTIGIWATVAGAAGDATAARVAAHNRLSAVSADLELTFAQSVMPVRTLANMVQQVPDYDAVMKMWRVWVPTMFGWVPGKELARRGNSLTLIPAGRVTAVYPPSAANNTIIGLDILQPGLRDEALPIISKGGMAVVGKSRGGAHAHQQDTWGGKTCWRTALALSWSVGWMVYSIGCLCPHWPVQLRTRPTPPCMRAPTVPWAGTDCARTYWCWRTRYEHRALLHSLLPRAAIKKMQAEFEWTSVDAAVSQVAMVESGTPAEMILSIMEDILLGRPPALRKVMAVRHTLQQSLDVYQPLQADLTQRMVHTGAMDGEVRDALMLQLVGRRAQIEAKEEEEGDQLPERAVSSCCASVVARNHIVLHLDKDDAHPQGSAAGIPLVTKQSGLTTSSSFTTLASTSKLYKLAACSTTTGPAKLHNKPVAQCHAEPAVSDQVTCHASQPGLLLSRNSVGGATHKQVAARDELCTSYSHQPSVCVHVDPCISSGSSTAAVAGMLQHMMAQQQPEAPPPGSGTALLQHMAAGDCTGAELAPLPQSVGHERYRAGQVPRGAAAARGVLPDVKKRHGQSGQDIDGSTHKCRVEAFLPDPLLLNPANHILGPGLSNAVPRAVMPLVESCLSTADSWAFDAFQLTSATAGRPLSVLAYWLLHQSGLAAWARLDLTKLARWLCRVEDGYCANPYHNRSHAADVVQTMHMVLTRGGLMPGYADRLTQLAAYLAAVCHDHQHVGRTNDWLVETQDELALRYNDRSPMENHHLASAFSLLKHPDLNFLQAMPKATYDSLRKLVIELVLGTDMKQHFSIIGQFTALHSTGGDGHAAGKAAPFSHDRAPQQGQPSRCSTSSSAKDCSQDSGASLQPVSDQDKLLSLKMALKCSDLGHLAAPFPVHLAWVSRLEAEFFEQGDAERALGLPISPLCDRTKQGITKSQTLWPCPCSRTLPTASMLPSLCCGVSWPTTATGRPWQLREQNPQALIGAGCEG